MRPLDRFQWEIRDGRELWITQRWSVGIDGDRISYFPVKGPGQRLGDQLPALVADTLYPAVTYTHGTPP